VSDEDKLTKYVAKFSYYDDKI